MALTPGTRLGPYEITAQIGVGGMREVYQAPDLSRRIARGLIPLDEALPVAKQIAEALEAARTGHSDDQGGGQLWIRSDARY